MDIFPLAADRLQAVAALRTAGVKIAPAVAPPGSAAGVVVELSETGVLLSAAVSSLETAPTIDSADFAGVAAAARLLVNNFNSLQNAGTSFGAVFVAALQTQAAANVEANSLFDALAAVGVAFQGNLVLADGRFSIDLDALQSGFAAQPVATAGILQQAIGSFGQSLASLFGQTGSLFGNNALLLAPNRIPTTVQLAEVAAAAQRALADATLNEAAETAAGELAPTTGAVTTPAAAGATLPTAPVAAAAATTAPPATAAATGTAATAATTAAATAAAAATAPAPIFDAADARRLVTDPAAAAIAAAHLFPGPDFATRMLNAAVPPVIGPDDAARPIRAVRPIPGRG